MNLVDNKYVQHDLFSSQITTLYALLGDDVNGINWYCVWLFSCVYFSIVCKGRVYTVHCILYNVQ